MGGLLGCGVAFLALKIFAGPKMGMLSIRMPPVVLLETLIAAAIIGFSAHGFRRGRPRR